MVPFRSALFLGALVVLAACGGDDPAPGLRLEGRLMQGANAQSEVLPLTGADVTLSVDANGNGLLEPNEASSTLSGDDGSYRVQREVKSGDRVVLRVTSADKAPLVRVFNAEPDASLQLDHVLQSVEGLGCDENGICSTVNRKLRVSGLPEDIFGSGNVFNPSILPSAMPGSLVDASGKAHRSMALAVLLFTDVDGNHVLELSAPARVCVDVPREAWPSVTDATAGGSTVEVRFHAFDEVSGTWTAGPLGTLEGPSGEPVTPADLAAITAGTRVPGISACASVTRGSYWSVGKESVPAACASGTVVDANDAPLAGASFSVEGVTFGGTGGAQVTDSSGAVCSGTVASGASEEQLRVRVVHEGRTYAAGDFSAPASAAVCGGGCLELGRLKLEPARELTARACEVRGTVVSNTGAPVAGAIVQATDDGVSRAAFEAVCGAESESCTTDALSGADGSFTVKLAVKDSLRLTADLFVDSETGSSTERFGAAYAQACPTEPVTVRLVDGANYYVLAVTVSGASIAWAPNLRARTLSVYDTQGTEKWSIRASDVTGFLGPVTYGTVPAGATRTFPSAGAPAALTVSDRVEITVSGTGTDGFHYSGAGSGP